MARRSSQAVTPRRRILVVEDNRDARDMLRTLLQTAGHEVHEASDGRQGVDAALRLRPDVALIDLGLPEMDGYEVARQIRAVDEGRRIMLVAVTGYGSPEDRERSLMAGNDVVLFCSHIERVPDIQRFVREKAKSDRAFAARLDEAAVRAETYRGHCERLRREAAPPASLR